MVPAGPKLTCFPVLPALTMLVEELDVPGHRTVGANPPSPLCASSENLMFRMRSCYFLVSTLLGPFFLRLFFYFRGLLLPSHAKTNKQTKADFAAVALRHGTSEAASLPLRIGG